MKKYVLVVAVAAALFSCSGNPKADATQTDKNKQETAQVPDMHNAETSLDYWGVYEGTLPAASSPGIKTTLTLNKDKTFTLIPTCRPARNDSRGGAAPVPFCFFLKRLYTARRPCHFDRKEVEWRNLTPKWDKAYCGGRF